MKLDVYHYEFSRVSCLAQTGFAAFGKGVQLISGPPYDETDEAPMMSCTALPKQLNWSGLIN